MGRRNFVCGEKRKGSLIRANSRQTESERAFETTTAADADHDDTNQRHLPDCEPLASVQVAFQSLLAGSNSVWPEQYFEAREPHHKRVFAKCKSSNNNNINISDDDNRRPPSDKWRTFPLVKAGQTR